MMVMKVQPQNNEHAPKADFLHLIVHVTKAVLLKSAETAAMCGLWHVSVP